VCRASISRSIFLTLVLIGQAWAFPMQPNIKVLLDKAKQPRPHYVPARAGWNGPEEKSADAIPNPTYDELRREPSAAEIRQQLLATAVPDWRVCLAILTMIVTLRMTKRIRLVRAGSILVFPSPRGTQPASAVSEAA
jgi:hypothetical protein